MRGLTKDNCKVGQLWKINRYSFKITRLGGDCFHMMWEDGMRGQLSYDYYYNKDFTLVLDFNDYYEESKNRG